MTTTNQKATEYSEAVPVPGFDPVSRPKHYASLYPEPITVIEGWGLGFHLGNAVKYLARAGRKDPDKEIEDCRKAIWYIERHIQSLKEGGAK